MALSLEELQALETQFDFEAQQAADISDENLTGTDDVDTLIGSASNEAIAGLAGNDTLFGKSGGDTILGGEGDDSIESNGGNALLVGDRGNDVLSAATSISAADDNSTLLGGEGNDILTGSTKDDLLFGGSEADVLFGGDGNDNLNGGKGSDTLNAGLADDTVFGDLDGDLLTGGDGNDRVDGGEGDDVVYDTQGSDSLTGGEGSDSFLLLPDTDTDTILDFQDGRDRFVLIEDFPERGLTFDQLEITENNGNTSIGIADTGEVLVELTGVSADAIDAEDFTSMTIEAMSNGEMGMDMTNEAVELAPDLINSQESTNLNEDTQAVENQPEQLAPEDQIGAVTSQGVEAMNVDEARNLFDVNGEGITIGVISDSFDRNLLTEISANDDILSGDLPGEWNPNGFSEPVSVLDDSADNSTLDFSSLSGGATDEGRGMLQLIHDVAPGAELIFNTGGNHGDRGIADAVNNLTAAGADIIVDDLRGITAPFFQDSLSSQAIDNAVAEGVAYFTSAGNETNSSYESEFRGVESEENSETSIPGLEGYVFHDFNPEAEVDIFQGVTLETGESIDLTFQWDEPFASVGGQGASNDLDIFLLDSENNIVASSTESNVGRDAVERLVFAASTDEQAGEYNLVVGQDVAAGGEAPGLIKYIDSNGGTLDAEYFTGGSTVYSNGNAAGAESVGAVPYQDTPAFGADEPIISDISSTGNTPILFDSEGNRLPEAEIRQQPQITAPDGTNTTFFPPESLTGGELEDIEGDGFPNFSGTSAAAPHAAGVAALLLEANPNATPEQVYEALEISALDMNDPYTPGLDPGYDAATGFGFIQADRALDAILGTSNSDIASSDSQEAFI
jgi:subtilisin family serine protease